MRGPESRGMPRGCCHGSSAPEGRASLAGTGEAAGRSGRRRQRERGKGRQPSAQGRGSGDQRCIAARCLPAPSGKEFKAKENNDGSSPPSARWGFGRVGTASEEGVVFPGYSIGRRTKHLNLITLCNKIPRRGRRWEMRN